MNKNSRKTNKQIIINNFGSKCQLCGYDKCLAALAFHHKDPVEKEFNISRYAGNKSLSYKTMRELTKCYLLCANCHAETHAGMHDNISDEIISVDFEDLFGD